MEYLVEDPGAYDLDWSPFLIEHWVEMPVRGVGCEILVLGLLLAPRLRVAQDRRPVNSGTDNSAHHMRRDLQQLFGIRPHGGNWGWLLE